MNWLVYDQQDSEIVGFGNTREEALSHALREQMLPHDCGLESWEQADLSQDASAFVGTWAAATQARYREWLANNVMAEHCCADAKYGEVLDGGR